MAPGPAARGNVAVGMKYGTAAVGADDVPSPPPPPPPKLKKLLVNSFGGAGNAPGNPGTCGMAKTGPAEVMASCFPCDFPQRINNFLPLTVNLLKVFSAATSAADLLVN